VFSIQICFEIALLICNPVNVESESAYEPAEIFLESIHVMRQKLATLFAAAKKLKGEDGDVTMQDA
jgi:hypothetical protein